MSNGEVRQISVQDIDTVQILIEKCLQLYMSEEEVVNTLSHQAKVEPGFTAIVVHNNSGYQVQQPAGLPINPENMHQAVTLPNVYTNGVSALQPNMQVPVNISGHGGRIDVPENMLVT
ncbi:uncharacterized protein LOC125189434 [Salvia hispanica]|uniref:uncharacterized protein LOC125189434 n=1 Tax=Salvia hispanica TaxID=49212 RepID=UPI002009D586|nr:uncharacterized protein LOC125189434 [Salvia hispanica]